MSYTVVVEPRNSMIHLPVLQEPFLNNLRRERVQVSVFLINGTRLQGVIDAFDSFTLVVRQKGSSTEVLKSSVATVVPVRDVPLSLTPPELQSSV